jgi:hypothetical protein
VGVVEGEAGYRVKPDQATLFLQHRHIQVQAMGRSQGGIKNRFAVAID